MRRFCNHGAKMQLAEYLATVYLKSGIQSKVQMYKPTNQTYNTSRYFNSKVDPSIGYCSNLRNCIIKMTGLGQPQPRLETSLGNLEVGQQTCSTVGDPTPYGKMGYLVGYLILPEFPLSSPIRSLGPKNQHLPRGANETDQSVGCF